MKTRLTGTELSKSFNRRRIFEGINVSVVSGETLLVTGRNGSGKSTLVKILCGLLTPNGGTVDLEVDGTRAGERRMDHLGMVAPYLQMYDEFSADENLRFALSARGLRPDEQGIRMLLERVGLGRRRADPVRAFSSGMKQRLKYAFALAHRPLLLVLDEPMANLDGEGTDMVRELMEEQQQRGLLIVATNDLSDVRSHHSRVDLNGP